MADLSAITLESIMSLGFLESVGLAAL